MSEEQGTDKKPIWVDDLLGGREKFAQFLTNYIVSRTTPEGEEHQPFNIALDAPWGQGKTFFVTRWMRQLRECDKPFSVVHFDAWKADYAADPLVAFLAAVTKGLESEIAALGLKTQAEYELSETIKKARRALWPVLKQVGSGMAAKWVGANFEEIEEAITSGTIDPLTNNTEENQEIALGEAKRGLDSFFKKYLEEQGKREAVIKDFKDSFKGVLGLIAETGKRQAPLFVFIDELDRCRPSFAIELLEGVKHIFDIPGVCFVFSVNLEQLSHSVCAVYGSAFNGHQYLKRFFDTEAVLPAPSRHQITELEISKYKNIKWETMYTHNPMGGFIENERGTILKTKDAIAWVLDEFHIDPRSIPKITEMIASSASSIANEFGNHRTHSIYLASLCCIKHIAPELFSQIKSRKHHQGLPSKELLKFLTHEKGKKHYSNLGRVDFDPYKPELQAYLSSIINEYQVMSLSTYNREDHNTDRPEYPQNLILIIERESAQFREKLQGHHPITYYPDHVELAGQLIRE